MSEWCVVCDTDIGRETVPERLPEAELGQGAIGPSAAGLESEYSGRAGSAKEVTGQV